MLIPVVEPVPKHQMWSWTTENKEAITASLADPRPSIEVKTSTQAAELAKKWADED